MSTLLHINLLQKDQGERPESILLSGLDSSRPYRAGLDWTCPVLSHVGHQVDGQGFGFRFGFGFGTKKPSNGGQINGGQANEPEVTP